MILTSWPSGRGRVSDDSVHFTEATMNEGRALVMSPKAQAPQVQAKALAKCMVAILTHKCGFSLLNFPTKDWPVTICQSLVGILRPWFCWSKKKKDWCPNHAWAIHRRTREEETESKGNLWTQAELGFYFFYLDGSPDGLLHWAPLPDGTSSSIYSSSHFSRWNLPQTLASSTISMWIKLAWVWETEQGYWNIVAFGLCTKILNKKWTSGTASRTAARMSQKQNWKTENPSRSHETV